MKKGTGILIATALVLAAAVPHAQQSGHALFEQALAKERVDGNLRDAIRTYERVVTDFASDRPLAAKALVQIGLCYEKLGRDEARHAYERLVRDFADQKDAVAQARARLAALERPGPVTANGSTNPSRRLIADLQLPPNTTWMDLTQFAPDGRHLFAYNLSKRAFELTDIETKQARTLTSDGPDPREIYPLEYLLSHDGRRIAATVSVKPLGAGHGELRVFDVGGHGPGRVVYSWAPGTGIRRPFAWASGNDRIGIITISRDLIAEIAWVDMNGKLSVLKRLEGRSDTQPPSLSPDGRFIAYHHRVDRTSAPDIYLLAADGSREVRVEDPASDSKPMFTPDGSGVVFESDRRGIRDLWFLPVKDGQPAGSARVVWRDIAPYGQALSFGENGSLFFFSSRDSWEIYTASLDLASGSVGQPQLVRPRNLEMNQAPAFSGDGRLMGYLRGDGGRRFVIQELSSGAEREIPFERAFAGNLSCDWCPDGEHVIVSGYDSAYAIESRTSMVRRLALENTSMHTLCTGDGSAVVYLRLGRGNQPGRSPMQVVRRSFATGEDQVLFEGAIELSTFSRSPDGKQIAFATAAEPRARLLLIPSAGGEPRELATYPFAGTPPNRFSVVRATVWSPDGASLLVAVREIEGGETAAAKAGRVGTLALWQVASDGSTPRRIGVLAAPQFEGSRFGVRRVSVDPQAKVLAFENHRGFEARVWAIDNLLRVIHAQ